jgi:signal transduction histidine kinase
MSKASTKKVLLVEDNPGDARLLREMLTEQDAYYHVALTHVGYMREAELVLSQSTLDIVLLDLGLPDAQGMDAVRRARTAAPNVPLVVLTGMDDETLAAQALQEGAQDYLIKGQIETRGLLRAMQYAIARNRLDRLKDEFIASVSHELRTPLTSISASLGLLVGNAAGELPGRVTRLLAIAHSNSQRLVRLVNDILDIEKMESGGLVFNLTRVEVRSLIEQAIAANHDFAQSHGVRIYLDDTSAAGDVRADADRLMQVFTNLMSNAVKFSPKNSEVTVAVENGADVVRISVRDHGAGIPGEFKPRIFDRFAQADSTNTRERGGTGLGLSIVKQIVDRLGGEVGFADAPGGGTVFHVALPLWKPEARIEVDLGAQSEAARILFCGDDLDTAVALRARLRDVGFATDFAYTAEDGLESAAARQYQAILVSRRLPDGNGTGVIQRLRELPQYAETPIIVVSDDPVRKGDDDPISPRLDVSDWLEKPVDFDRLMQTLGEPAGHGSNGRGRIRAAGVQTQSTPAE